MRISNENYDLRVVVDYYVYRLKVGNGNKG